MNCLTDKIGLRLCGNTSEYYVDDIPGIPVNLVSSIKDEQKRTLTEWFNNLKASAYKQFLIEAELKFSGEKSFNHIISETNTFTSDPAHYISINPSDLVGYKVEIPTHEFVEYRLNHLNFNVHTAGTVDVVIINLVDGNLLYNNTETLVKGRNKIKVDYTVTDPEKNLFVGIKNSTTLTSVLCGEPKCGCGEETDYGTLEGNVFTQTDIKYFCVDAQIRCNFETMICNYPEFFINAMNYFLALSILDHKVNSYERGWYSDANNKTVLEFTIPILKKKFNTLMDLALTNLYKITDDSICWSCNSRLANKPMLTSYV
jgi:hypothetical protein